MTFLVSIETTCFFLLVPNGVLWDYWVEVKAETWPRVLFAKTFDLLRHFNLGTKIKLRSLKRSSRKKWEKRRRIVFHDFQIGCHTPADKQTTYKTILIDLDKKLPFAIFGQGIVCTSTRPHRSTQWTE